MNAETLALHWRRTKIIATLGPASDSPAMINKLLDAGVNVVRLNMSHGDHEGHRVLFKRVRAAAKRQKKNVAILKSSWTSRRTPPLQYEIRCSAIRCITFATQLTVTFKIRLIPVAIPAIVR